MLRVPLQSAQSGAIRYRCCDLRFSFISRTCVGCRRPLSRSSRASRLPLQRPRRSTCGSGQGGCARLAIRFLVACRAPNGTGHGALGHEVDRVGDLRVAELDARRAARAWRRGARPVSGLRLDDLAERRQLAAEVDVLLPGVERQRLVEYGCVLAYWGRPDRPCCNRRPRSTAARAACGSAAGASASLLAGARRPRARARECRPRSVFRCAER